MSEAGTKNEFLGKFDRRELYLICDACNGWWRDDDDLPMLWAEIEDSIKLDDTGRKWGLTETECRVLVEVLKGLSKEELLVLDSGIRKFWEVQGEGGIEAAFSQGA